MHQIKCLLLALAFCLSNALPVAAADWDGFYAGGGLGLRTLEADWQTTDTTFPDFGGGAPYPPSSATEASLEDEGSGIAIFAGYNWVFGPGFLVSAEAGIESLDVSDRIEDRIPGLGDTSSSPTSYSEIRAEDDGISIRVRGGYLLTSELLLYVSAGKSSLKVDSISTCPADTNVCDPGEGTQSFTSSKKMDGDTLGLGMEYMISERLLLRGEYRQADFGSFSFVAIPSSVSTFGADATLEVETTSFELGAAFKF